MEETTDDHIILSDEDVIVLRQMIAAWKALSALGAIANVLKKMFWFIGLIIAFYLAASGKITYLTQFLANIG